MSTPPDLHVAHAERAAALDAADPLATFRDRFIFPDTSSDRVLYFTGNSLGLQPSTAATYVQRELDDWARLAVDGHLSARNPWWSYHHQFKEPLAMIVGGKPQEVVAMNTLTVNLHLMLASFYKPTQERYKVLMVGHEFPSDRYAVASQLQWHGFDPHEGLLEVESAPGTFEITDEQIVSAIESHADSLALVMISAVHYYTGQLFPLDLITRTAHAVGAMVGFDLAHAAGNVQPDLHEVGADFAVWCSYKYLNSGPGGVGGAFVHERHAHRTDLVRLAGWWGNDEATRFHMDHDFVPTPGADGWQLSNAQILPMAAHKASLDIFMEAGMDRIARKRDQLTAFAWDVITDVVADRTDVRIITPADPSRRGAQLSIQFDHHGRAVFDALTRRGVIVDWRVPNVIRMAPAPLYNSFADVAEFGKHLAESLVETAS
ncbi:MAG: kynureninase [Candidatus Kapaibacteriota bacterium]|jgi:kynureninase